MGCSSINLEHLTLDLNHSHFKVTSTFMQGHTTETENEEPMHPSFIKNEWLKKQHLIVFVIIDNESLWEGIERPQKVYINCG